MSTTETPYIQVTFDASGQNTRVDPNPAAIQKLSDGRLRMVWVLAREEDMFSQWRVDFGNVVPQVASQLGPTLQSGPTTVDGKPAWEWVWEPPDPKLAEISYEIFLLYGPKTPEGVGLKRVPRSLREVLSVDPTLLLPPEHGGGG